ncbi:glycoside hydrolase N-terminal domain-containing protein [Streptomyces sp. CC208A]|uniref:glycoside hydrolase N-terminal domain-containing protein n=1 Tax=Streptomyces sp. CC208A TaxID=3044573 RepID=UPI0024A8605A|nr:glycoside hydrolase N-terminal domain-containing protein [Streptomyces sp. CC208A]
MSEPGPVHGTWEPAPAARSEDAFPTGNGRHGALVYGDPVDDRVIVTHHTFVRPHHRPGDTEPARPAGLLTRVRAETPGGGPMTGRAVDFTTGVVTATAGDRTSRVFVSRADDVLVQYVTEPGPRVRVELDHRLDGGPAGLAAGRGIATAHGETLLTLRADRPGSPFGHTALTLVVADTGRTTLTDRGIRAEGAGRLLLLTRVRRHDGPYDPGGETAALRALAGEDGPAAAYARLLDRHTGLHRAAYLRVALDLAAAPAERALSGSALLARPAGPALLERLFAAGRYHRLSSPGLLPPRLCGLRTDADPAPPPPLVEALVRSTPGRLVLLPPPGICARGRLTGLPTRFGARLDLAWAPGEYRAVLRPGRDADLELCAPEGSRRLVLRAGEERVLVSPWTGGRAAVVPSRAGRSAPGRAAPPPAPAGPPGR